MIAISELKAQHGAIRAAARHLLDVAVATRGYRAAASGLLHDLASAIDTHATAEAHAERRARLRGADAIDGLSRDWRAYRTTWSTGRVAADWAGFVAATQALMPRMLAHLDSEDAALDAVAAR